METIQQSFSVLVVVFMIVVVVGGPGAWIAHQKGRSKIEGAFLAIFFPVIGLLVELLLPTRWDRLDREDFRDR